MTMKIVLRQNTNLNNNQRFGIENTQKKIKSSVMIPRLKKLSLYRFFLPILEVVYPANAPKMFQIFYWSLGCFTPQI